MLPAGGVLEQARQTRDPRFDGRFFVAVRTTGIYCRPVCLVKMPRAENVTFYDSAAAATEAGYRPCLRCRPEASPGTPAWQGTSTTVKRALKLIDDGALDQGGVPALSERLGVTPRHLNRLFTRHVGASPKTIAKTRRLQFAKRLIDETDMSMTEIALSAGYGSIRRFNDHFRQTYHRTPSSLRTDRVRESVDRLEIPISYRAPYDFDSLLDFYRLRATPGVESVTDGYERSFRVDGADGRLGVTKRSGELVCTIQGGSPASLMSILQRVRRMFDVDAVPGEINEVLRADPVLRKLVRGAPGLRIPGAFDSFEASVRSIVGQQVSVRGATTVMGRIAERYGEPGEIGLLFPSPEALADLDPASLPMPAKRALAIRELARRVAEGDIVYDQPDDEAFRQSLLSIPGIGPWTVDYISMRARSDPNAFLSGDLVIREVGKSLFDIDKETDLLKRAERWRPWRGYAGMHLWRHAAASKD